MERRSQGGLEGKRLERLLEGFRALLFEGFPSECDGASGFRRGDEGFARVSIWADGLVLLTYQGRLRKEDIDMANLEHSTPLQYTLPHCTHCDSLGFETEQLTRFPASRPLTISSLCFVPFLQRPSCSSKHVHIMTPN